jgi:threonine dehydratase
VSRDVALYSSDRHGISDPHEAVPFVAPHLHRTPPLTSSMLSKQTGLDVRLKAEMFQRTGSYKFRGPLHKFAQLSAADRARGDLLVRRQPRAGVALGASLFGVKATVVMASNATLAKIRATRRYGAEVVVHGDIWDEANAESQRLAAEQGLTYIHPFDDYQLIAGQGTLGIEVREDAPDVDAVIVPIGGGGLISGVATALKLRDPRIRVIGRVQRVGERNLGIVREYVDEIVTVADQATFDAVVWLMAHCKVVPEGTAAATVAALQTGAVAVAPGSTVVAVLSGGNADLSFLAGRRWN